MLQRLLQQRRRGGNERERERECCVVFFGASFFFMGVLKGSAAVGGERERRTLSAKKNPGRSDGTGGEYGRIIINSSQEEIRVGMELLLSDGRLSCVTAFAHLHRSGTVAGVSTSFPHSLSPNPQHHVSHCKLSLPLLLPPFLSLPPSLALVVRHTHWLFFLEFNSNFNKLCGFSSMDTIQTLRKQIVKSILKVQVWPACCQERNVLLKSNTMMSQILKLGEAFTGIEFALLSWYENQIPVL